MSEIALRFDHVYKKFSRGETHDSLRDLIPALARGLLRRVARPFELRTQEFWALQDVSFEIRRGEAVGIIGHNGAGKSTILKHLSGLMRPTAGRLDVNGKLSALIEVGAGFHQDLTGRENVFLNGVILGMSRAEVRRKFDEIVDFSGIKDFIDMPVKRYSSGMHARLGFAIAAHMEPDILIVDEVLSVGDYTFQAKGLQKMKSVLNNGTTVVFVSHNLRSVADLCPRSILMKKGTLLGDGPTTQILHSYMEQMASGRSQASGDNEAVIASAAIRGSSGSKLDFISGEKMWVQVTLRALRAARRLACIVYIRDSSQYQIFNISSERLAGGKLIDLEPGEERTCEFELQMHLAPGTFHVCTTLIQPETGRWFENIEPIASIVMNAPIEVGGSVNLYPRLSVLDEAEAAPRRVSS